jgi:hypothetical protein
MAMESTEPLLGAEAYTMPLMCHATIVDSFNCLTFDHQTWLVWQLEQFGQVWLVWPFNPAILTSFKQSVSHSEGFSADVHWQSYPLSMGE